MVVCLVYGLRSSRDARVRYIGQTTKSLERRFAKHRENARLKVRTHLYNWIRSEMDAGHVIDAIVLNGNATWNETERALIASHVDLVNQTAGGDGTLGWKPSAEQLARLSASHIGQIVTPESIAKRKATRSTMNIRMTDGTKAALVAANKGRKLTPEAIAKRTATRRANGGYVQSAEARKKRSDSLRATWAARKSENVVRI